jgi:putative intracellular protease/amidase
MSDPRDPSEYSIKDLISRGFIATPKLYALVEATKPLADLKVADYDAIVVAGGQAPMFLYDKATLLHQKFAEFYESGKITSCLW